MKLKKVISSTLMLSMLIGAATQNVHAVEEETTKKFDIIAEVFDYGESVTSVVVDMEEAIDATQLSTDTFSVSAKNYYADDSIYPGKVYYEGDRDITNIYVNSTQIPDGEPDKNGQYVVIELKYGWKDAQGNKIKQSNTFEYNLITDDKGNFDNLKSHNLALKLNYQVSLNQNLGSLKAGYEFEQGEVVRPIIDQFEKGESNGLQYRLYTPSIGQNSQRPLIVWFHGSGEGGTNNSMQILANKGGAGFATEEAQQIFGGAYVLAPQCPDNWSYDIDYTDQAIALINEVVDNNNIDPNRIIIAGCSAGGYMTWKTLLKNPDMFAAAIPICADAHTYEEIETVKDVPIWLVHSKDDGTVTVKNSINNANILTELGADVTLTLYENVTGYDEGAGVTQSYSGHWSWVYALNNDPKNEQGQSLFEWIAQQTLEDGRNEQVEEKYDGTQKAYVVGEDWGAAVSKTIITLNQTVKADSIDKDTFSVVEHKYNLNSQSIASDKVTTRVVEDAYVSDANGNKVTGNSKYVTIEMRYNPNEGSPLTFSMETLLNQWCNYYKLDVQLNKAIIAADGKEIKTLNIKPDINVASQEERISPEADKYQVHTYTAKVDGTKYSYADYIPEKDDQKNALVIWLHGLGEGGTDPYIDILANEVTCFVSDEFQEKFGGAYVLVPQTPTMWMEDGQGNMQYGEVESPYTKSLFELIDTYVKNNPDIDPDRILLVGASNGGYMTMEMIMNYPDYFAAAVPICEGFKDVNITDEMLESIKDLPIWFVYAKNDPTVEHKDFCIPTIERLIAAKASNLHVSAFEDVHDDRFCGDPDNPRTLVLDKDTGVALQYSGHWAWVWFFNNACVDDNDASLSAWDWLSLQTKAVKSETPNDQPILTPVDQPSTPVEDPVKAPQTGDSTNVILPVTVLMLSMAAGYIVLRKRKEF